jgi:hypothetical protein
MFLELAIILLKREENDQNPIILFLGKDWMIDNQDHLWKYISRGLILDKNGIVG